MPTLQATAASTLSLPADNYIYSIAASAQASFAAISSDDSLRVFDAASLDHVSVISHKTHTGGVTSLRSYPAGDSQLLATGGREGTVKLWDVRSGNAVLEMEMRKFSFTLLSWFMSSSQAMTPWDTLHLDEDCISGIRSTGVGGFLRHHARIAWPGLAI